MDIQPILILTAAGLAGGIIAGMFGIGGGIIYVLVYNGYLTHHLPGVPSEIIVHLTILNTACSILAAAVAGSLRQVRNHNFYPKQTLVTGLAGAFSAFLITELLKLWSQYDQRMFLIVFTVALLPLIVKFIPGKSEPKEKDVPLPVFSVAGLIAGIGSALSGLGGGFILNPLLYGFFHYPLKKTFSVSLGSMLFTMVAIILSYTLTWPEYQLPLHHQYNGVILPMVLPVILGVLIATPLGIALQHRIKAKKLSWLFFILAILIVIRNLYLIISHSG